MLVWPLPQEINLTYLIFLKRVLKELHVTSLRRNITAVCLLPQAIFLKVHQASLGFVFLLWSSPYSHQFLVVVVVVVTHVS